MKQSVVIAQETEVALEPRVRQQLIKEFRLYATQKAIKEAAEQEMDAIKGRLATVRDELGEMSVGVEGFKTTLVAPVRSKLNINKLVTLGCALAWVKEATEIRPGRMYEKVTCPGERPVREEE